MMRAAPWWSVVVAAWWWLPVGSGMATTTTYKRVSLDFIEFGGKLSLDSVVRGSEAGRLAAFLTPKRVVSAAWKAQNVEALGGGGEGVERFRLKQDPLDFAALRVTTFVDVAVTPGDRGGLTLASEGIVCKASWAGQGERQLDVRIDLGGVLEPQGAEGGPGRIRGAFDFTTSGRLVGPLLLTPDPVIRLAADLVVAGVVEYARSRFVTGVRDSLLAWDGADS